MTTTGTQDLESIVGSTTHRKEVAFHRQGLLQPLRRKPIAEDLYQLIHEVQRYSQDVLAIEEFNAIVENKDQKLLKITSYPEFEELYSGDCSYAFRNSVILTQGNSEMAKLSCPNYQVSIYGVPFYTSDDVVVPEFLLGFVAFVAGVAILAPNPAHMAGFGVLFGGGGGAITDAIRRIQFEGKSAFELQTTYKGSLDDKNGDAWTQYSAFIGKLDTIKS